MKKRKHNKYKRTSFFVALGITALILCLPVVLIVLNHNKQPNDTPTYASGLGKDLYGISGHLAGLSTTDLNKSLDDYKALGVQWVRDDFSWPVIQPSSASSYDWTSHDAFVTAANARGIKVLGIIDYTPSWEVPSGCTASDTTHCPPKSNTDYANFAVALVKHYAPMGVHTWEIWNEENSNTFWASPNTANYTALLKAAYPVIKQADPNSLILTGGIAPVTYTGTVDIPAVDFLTGIYQNGGKGYFDAVAYHPYCVLGNVECPKIYDASSGWSQMQDTNPSLRSIMTANGDQGKKIWATEFGAPTGGSASYAIAVTETQQAQILTDAYTVFNSYSWAGPLFWYTYIDPCTTTTDVECYFGLVRPDYSQKPSYNAYKNLATNSSATPTPTPTMSPTSIPTPSPSPVLSNLIKNSSFENTGSNWLSPWAFIVQAPATGSVQQVSKTKVDGRYSAKVTITTANSNDWYIQLSQPYLPFIAGKTYTLSFWAKASVIRNMPISIMHGASPWTNYAGTNVTLNTSWNKYTFSFTAPQSDSNADLVFNLAGKKGYVWLDEVSLQ